MNHEYSQCLIYLGLAYSSENIYYGKVMDTFNFVQIKAKYILCSSLFRETEQCSLITCRSTIIEQVLDFRGIRVS